MLSDMNAMAKGISRYALVMASAKRARQLQEGTPVIIDKPRSNKFVCIALEEFTAGKITIYYPAKDQTINLGVED